MREMTNNDKEEIVENCLIRECTMRGWRCLKFHSPGVRGVPDRIVMAQCGVIAFIETKRPKGGKVSPLQTRFKKDANARGIRSFITRTVREVNSAIQELEDEVQTKAISASCD